MLGRFEKLADAAIANEIRSENFKQEVEDELRAKERPRRLRVMEKKRWERLREQAGNWYEAESLHTCAATIRVREQRQSR